MTYLTVPQAAVRLGIARQRAYSLVYAGVLPSQRHDGHILIPLEAVETRLAEQRVHARWVSTDEVARFFGVHPRTVLTWHSRGLIPAVRVHRDLRYDPAVVAKFVPPHTRASRVNPEATRTLRGRFYPPPPDVTPNTQEREHRNGNNHQERDGTT